MTNRTVTLVLSCLALAQPALAGDAPKGDLFAGYSYTQASSGGDKQSLNGWQASGARNFGSHLGVVLDAAGHYGSLGQSEKLSDLSFMAGPRFAIRTGSLTLFAQGLAGWGQRSDSVEAFVTISESTSGFAWAAGGGLSLRLAKRWDARAQADYWSVKGGSSRTPIDDRNVRFAAGLAYVFGR